MKIPAFLALSASVLFWFEAQAQTSTPFPDDVASPTPTIPGSAADYFAVHVPPTPPALQPLAPVAGPAIKVEKGFPFHGESGGFTFNIGDDHDKSDKSTKSDDELATEFIMPMVIVGIVFISPILLIGVILYYRHRKSRLLHQTIQSLVEKGLPIPPELLAVGGKPLPTNHSDRRRGYLLTCIGAGLVLFFLANHSHSWGVGFIPLGIGIGYLLTSKFAPRGPDQP